MDTTFSFELPGFGRFDARYATMLDEIVIANQQRRYIRQAQDALPGDAEALAALTTQVAQDDSVEGTGMAALSGEEQEFRTLTYNLTYRAATLSRLVTGRPERLRDVDWDQMPAPLLARVWEAYSMALVGFLVTLSDTSPAASGETGTGSESVPDLAAQDVPAQPA